jgi:hypothetical protein
MTSFPALDVAIGLSFAYFLFSILATTITETISRFTKMRSRKLEGWLRAVLADPETSATKYEDFLKTPIIRALLTSVGRPAPQHGKLPHPPSYIPSTHFVAAALSAGRSATRTAEDAGAAAKQIDEDLTRLQGTVVGDALRELYDRSAGDVVRFRGDAEAWFDDQMERLSGVYRRWSQAFVWAVGAALVVAVNANTFRIADTLWTDPAKRAAIVAQAGQASTNQNPTDAISSLPLPLGWSDGYHGVGWLWALIGVLLTLAAVSLGAPFWFDTLSRFSRIRQTGTPPPASNAIRGGEGDQRRTLPSLEGWTPSAAQDTTNTTGLPARPNAPEPAGSQS